MALFSNLYALKLQRLEKILRQTSGSKSARMAKLWQFRQGHPKPAFSEKVQRGDEEKFFKDSPKHSPNLKGPTALWRKSHYPLISMQLKCKDWRKFWRKQRLQKCPNGQGNAIFGRSPKTRIFCKSAKGRPRKNFQKSPRKYPRFKGPRPLWRKSHYPLICIHLYCKDWTRFWRIRWLQKCPNGQVMAIFARPPKPAFCEKVQRGDQGEFFKNRLKSTLT